MQGHFILIDIVYLMLVLYTHEFLLAIFSKIDPSFIWRDSVSNFPVFLNQTFVLSVSRHLEATPAQSSLQQTNERVQTTIPSSGQLTQNLKGCSTGNLILIVFSHPAILLYNVVKEQFL